MEMPTGRLRRFLYAAAVSLSFLLLSGCPSTSDTDETADADAAKADATVSDVPLRVWIVAPVKDQDVVTRKWLGDTPQPIKITEVSTDALLDSTECKCDVLVYPSRLLGDLVARKWVTPLPKKIVENKSSQDSPLRGLTPTQVAQAKFDQDMYAVPIGTDIPGLAISPKLAESIDGAVETPQWDYLLEQLDLREFTLDDGDIDGDALVDRFLAISASLADRDPKYGLLLQLPKLQPLLSRRPEFLQAAEILLAIAKQTSDGKLACGPHSEVLQAVTATDSAAAAVVPLASLDDAAGAIKQGGFLAILPGPTKQAASSEGESDDMAASEETTKQALKSWNVGGGLNVSLADDCSQTAQATNFLQWIAAGETRSFLARQIPGVLPASPTDGVDAIRWQGIQKQMSLSGGSVFDALPQEFRMPGARRYRAALAQGLVRYLKGEIDADNALRSVEAEWIKINRSEPDQVTNFKKSLGLLN
ncbi:MAG: hypothetical protein Aurels2KO_51740 [Aureliella sp.]